MHLKRETTSFRLLSEKWRIYWYSSCFWTMYRAKTQAVLVELPSQTLTMKWLQQQCAEIDLRKLLGFSTVQIMVIC